MKERPPELQFVLIVAYTVLELIRGIHHPPRHLGYHYQGGGGVGLELAVEQVLVSARFGRQ